MTAEIAIMNRSAVALAGDSAVTVETIDGPKIYNTAHKLFRLSFTQPVGIMLYGQGAFLSVPWETIIKEYREHLQNKSFPALKDYSNDFIRFIGDNKLLFPDDIREEYVINSIGLIYEIINNRIMEDVQVAFIEKQRVTDSKISKIAAKAINDSYSQFKKSPLLKNVDKKEIRQINSKYSDKIEEFIKHIFENIPLYKKDLKKLREIPGHFFCKDVFLDNLSGIVFAGYGAEDVFPKLCAFELEALLNGRIKHKKESVSEINHHNGAVIRAFAQGEMVHSFMEGIDPNLCEIYDSYVKKILNGYPKIISKGLKGLTPKKRNQIIKNLNKASSTIFDHYNDTIKNFRTESFVLPVTQAVSILPKDELASMAESLVNLTIFKRKVSIGHETVGGPIDVALISRGDGFVWIKRKHYFKQELNPRYVMTHYKGERKND